jgi:hypothetical protein
MAAERIISNKLYELIFMFCFHPHSFFSHPLVHYIKHNLLFLSCYFALAGFFLIFPAATLMLGSVRNYAENSRWCYNSFLLRCLQLLLPHPLDIAHGSDGRVKGQSYGFSSSLPFFDAAAGRNCAIIITRIAN